MEIIRKVSFNGENIFYYMFKKAYPDYVTKLYLHCHKMPVSKIDGNGDDYKPPHKLITDMELPEIYKVWENTPRGNPFMNKDMRQLFFTEKSTTAVQIQQMCEITIVITTIYCYMIILPRPRVIIILKILFSHTQRVLTIKLTCGNLFYPLRLIE